MRILLLGVVAVVGFVYFKGGNLSNSSSSGSGGNNKEMAKLADSKQPFDLIIKDIYDRQYAHSEFVRTSRNISTKELISGNKKFLADYYKLLGKAYKASSGGDRKAVKVVKDHMVKWFKVSLQYLKKVDTSMESLKFSQSGNLTDQIATNNAIMEEISKWNKQLQHFEKYFVGDFTRALKATGMSKASLKSYCKDLINLVNEEHSLNGKVYKVCNKMLDKAYWVNTWLMNNLKGGRLVVKNQNQIRNLNAALKELTILDKQLSTLMNQYYNR